MAMLARSKLASATRKTTRMEKRPHSPTQLDLDRPIGRNRFLERCFQWISINGRNGRGLFCLVLGCLRSTLRGRFREVGSLGLLIHLHGVASRDVGWIIVGHDDGDPVLSVQGPVIGLERRA